MSIEVVESKNMFQVVEGSAVHATYPFNSISSNSRHYAKQAAEAFRHGYLYALAGKSIDTAQGGNNAADRSNR